MAIDKDFYNSSSAAKLGWEPSWFGVKFFDDELVKKVQKWQKEHGLVADGLVGPATHRRVWTDREVNISNYEPSSRVPERKNNYIVHNGNFLPIDWDKVVLWDDEEGLTTNPGQYYDFAGKPDRQPTMFVNHWDVCLSAESCAKILGKRGISIHFCLDNDGTIYQLLDTQHGAWHAGVRGSSHGNKKGIGIEISNAYYTKYQDWYVKHGFGKRPVQEHGYVHGRTLSPFLDFYPIQLEALKALWKAIHLGIGIPLEYPATPQGDVDTGVHKPCFDGTFNGFCNHYNFTRGKIDCAGLDLPTLLEEAKQSLFCEDK